MQSEKITKKDILLELDYRELTNPSSTMLWFQILATALTEPDPEHPRGRLQVLAAVRNQIEGEITVVPGIEGNRTPKTWAQIADELGMNRSTAHRKYSLFANKYK